MTPTLRERMVDIRQKLEAGDQTAGFIAPPSLRRSLPEFVPQAYQEFLREADGAACGVVMLFESEGLSDQQSPARALSGGTARWFCFGAVEDYPLVIDRRNGGVHLIPEDGEFDESDPLGNLDHFLEASVFGPEYADFVVEPESDPWYQLLKP